VFVAKTLGYMVTWTTYGTWLQGDERGYVKNGRICPGNKALMESNKQLQLQDAVKLSKTQQQFVRKAIAEQARLQGQRIYALSVQSNHVHIVAEYIPLPISKVVAYYKNAARLALKSTGHNGKLWTRGYDKRFFFDVENLRRRIKYVNSQNPA
jgi:REP element-mobilizing transposase RayT